MDLYDIRLQLGSGKSIFDIEMRVTYYARVSTDKDEQMHSLSAQINYYTDLIKSNSNWRFVDGYIDEGISGTSVNKRDSFIRMIDDAKINKFDFVITKEISRFSRNTIDSIKYTQELLSCGVGVFFQSDNINTLMPDSELRLTIMASIAQDEVRKTSERVKFGFKRAIENGVVLGNNKIWGYNKENGKLKINKDEAEMIRIIFDMYANERLGMRSICNALSERGYKNSRGNNFSFSTIKGILTNPKYKGYYCGGKSHKYDYKLNDRKYLSQEDWVMYKDEENVPPIVSEELWDKANAVLQSRSAKRLCDEKSSYQNKYKYSGKIICMNHDLSYHRGEYKYKSGDKEIWRCKKYVEQGKAGCNLPILYTTEIDELVKMAMSDIVIDKEKIISDLIKIYTDILSSSETTIDIAAIKNDISSIVQKKDKLLDLSMKGRLSDEEFEVRNNRFNEQIQSMQSKIVELELEEEKNREVSKTINILRDLITQELEFENGVDYNIVDCIIRKIEIYQSGDQKIVNIKVYLKLINQVKEFYIDKRKRKTSFCSGQYI